MEASSELHGTATVTPEKGQPEAGCAPQLDWTVVTEITEPTRWWTGWAPQLVQMWYQREKSLFPLGIKASS